MAEEKTNKITKVSASSLKTYTSCNKKYYYSYIEKLPKKVWDHLDLGNFAHTTLEYFHNTWNNNKNLQLSTLMGEAFSFARKKYPSLKTSQLLEAKEMLQNYLTMVETKGMPNVLGVEVPFEIQIDKYTLKGFIDRLDIDKDGIFHIIDYKTTKNEKYLDDFQILTYGIALKNKYPEIKKFRGSYILLRNNSKYLSYDFTLHDIEKCEKEIKELANIIQNEKEWKKNPSPLCRWCDFYNPCQSSNDENNWIV